MKLYFQSLLLWGLWLSGWAQAQVLDSLTWVEGTNPPMARLSFTPSVHLLRQSPTPATGADLWKLSVQLVGSDGNALSHPMEESRRLPSGPGHPALDVLYTQLNNVDSKLVTVRISEKASLLVRQGPGGNTLDLLLMPVGKDPRVQLPSMAEAPEDRHFAVVLQTSSAPTSGASPRIPAEFQDYAVFSQPNPQTAGATDLAIGYFRTRGEAEQVLQSALRHFSNARILALDKPSATTTQTQSTEPPAPAIATTSVAPRAELTTPPAPVAPPSAPMATTPSVSPVASDTSDVSVRGATLLGQARAAMDQAQYPKAADLLNQALMLPPNPSTEPSQELIGNVWERLDNPAKARLEYELYLKLYPQGAGANRVSQRLQALPINSSAKNTAAAKPRFTATGSISQYYYGGNTKTDSLVTIAAGIDQNTLSRTSQSVLVSSWDATGRYQGDESETKLVMRGAHSDNLAASSTTSTGTQGLISAAYLDYRDLKSRTDVRLGRQSAIGGAMFGLFDGVSMATPVGDGLKFDAMLGVPANQLVTAPQQTMVGVMLEADSIMERWGGNVSLMEQTTESISDRRAMGLEVRYFGDAVSVFSQIDYEINLQSVNAVTLQGSIQGPSDSTITLMFDDRRAPSLQLSNALISSGKTSLATLLQLYSLNEVQRMALDTSAQAKQAMVSLSRPLSEKWQGSVDLRYSEIGALPAVGNFQAQPATGAQYSTSLQLTGTNLYSNRDINGFNLSYLTSDTLNGMQLAYNNLTGIWDNQASLEPSIRLYTQTDNTDTKVLRYSTGLRLSYKLSNRASVMGEGIYEQSQTDGPSNHETSSAMYFYMGYRYDFQ